jgi:formate-dependent nitrite reductase membrane component NrfD
MTDLGFLGQLGINPQAGVPLPPRWGWYVVSYFFVGGITAGVYAIACALDAVGDPRDRDAVHLGYRLAFPGVLLCGILLVVDLGQPFRFWHMLFKSEHFPALTFKPWSPISLGSWILSAFGAFSLVSFLLTTAETGRPRWRPLLALHAWWRRVPNAVRMIWLALGALAGFGLAGYTGVLMIATTRPVWHNAYLLGGLFLASAFSTSYAFLTLALLRRGRRHGDSTVTKLDDAERWSLSLEIVLLALTLIWLGGSARPLFTGGYGVLFWVGVVGLGLLAPLLLRRVRVSSGSVERRARLRAACILVGGLTLRFVLVMAPQWPLVKPWHL